MVIKQKINAQNIDVLFYVLSDQMRKVGLQFSKSQQSDDKLIYSFHGQLTANQINSKAFKLILKETPSLQYEKINSDESLKKIIIAQIKETLSESLKIKIDQIQILGLEKGSIIVDFITDIFVEIQNFSQSVIQAFLNLFPGSSPQLHQHPYFQQACLSMEDFNQQYNTNWDHYEFGDYEYRGQVDKPEPYFYPVGWEGHALQVAGKYGTNDNWLMMNGNQEEWSIMYHGTTFLGFKGIMANTQQIIKGTAQRYKEKICLLTNQVIGEGVYFSNHIEVCEGFAIKHGPTEIGNRKFIVAFQTRVKPEALRQCEKESSLRKEIIDHKEKNPSYNTSLDDMNLWNNDYFVVNNTEDIRPYRILLKEVNQRQRMQNEQNDKKKCEFFDIFQINIIKYLQQFQLQCNQHILHFLIVPFSLK